MDILLRPLARNKNLQQVCRASDRLPLLLIFKHTAHARFQKIKNFEKEAALKHGYGHQQRRVSVLWPWILLYLCAMRVIILYWVSRYIEQEVVSLRQALTELISSSIVEDFARVWSRIGLTSNQRKLRRETMGVHISSLLKDILQEEEELEKSMIDSLQNNEIELISLCKQLGFPTEAVCHECHDRLHSKGFIFLQLPSTRSLYEREKETRGRVDALNKVYACSYPVWTNVTGISCFRSNLIARNV